MSPAPVSVTVSSVGALATGGYEASPARSTGVGAGVGATGPDRVTRTTATSATAATAKSAASAPRKRLPPAGTPVWA
jgi:hypothetical protein